MAEFRGQDQGTKGSIVFHLHEGVGTLASALDLIKSCDVSLSHIESRPCKDQAWEYDFLVQFPAVSQEKLDEVKKVFEESSLAEISFISSAQGTPWFPRNHDDMDRYAIKELQYGDALDTKHPGFTDEVYRKRRVDITRIAKEYKAGQPIPRVDYSDQENETWGAVYTNLMKLAPTHACKQYNYILPILAQNAGYGPEKIPQLEDVSKVLKKLTGWTLRPVTGLLTSRDFLNGLAFRVFHSTQYIRHHSKPMYTPEPDVCHELLGHVPLFADPDFADFSQEIGLASLGATDEEIVKLATVYWFTVEFGICKEDGEYKAYGAGLLSSFGELEYCLSGTPKLEPFNPNITSLTEYPVTMFQPLYYYTESFEDAKRKVRDFAQTKLKRPFSVRLNALTGTIEVLDNKNTVSRFSKEIASSMAILSEAIGNQL
eukprot:TRINITY_DN10499_c0_g1_i1.p1 TRINITY_DN10499_c0_g1~~TRINITY_DN10499_c0_g1_i1.p1  ORF type:complete len:442 (-),score=113.55 TRINITY_DN10499_c0_g1_i1:124-1410(-)